MRRVAWHSTESPQPRGARWPMEGSKTTKLGESIALRTNRHERESSPSPGTRTTTGPGPEAEFEAVPGRSSPVGLCLRTVGSWVSSRAAGGEWS